MSSKPTRIDTSYPIEETADLEPMVLKSTNNLGCGFFILLVLSVVWNGFMLLGSKLFVGEVPGGWAKLGTIVFMIPFLLIGFGLILGTIYVGLATFNPRPVLVCSQQYLYPGEEFELSWMFPKSSGRITSLAIYIEGSEQASYRQGTTTRTETHIFFREVVLESSDRSIFERGERIVCLPHDIMHTFNTTNNKILWQVRFHGSIPWWPDLADIFTIEVLPPKLTGFTAGI